MTSVHAALEIGTSRTVLAIGEGEVGGRLKVICHADIPSSGVRKSQILSIQDATQSIRSVIHKIEDKQSEAGLKVSLHNAVLAVSGQHIVAQPFNTSVPIDGKVTDDNIDAVIRASQEMALPKDRELLDVIEQDYAIDNRGSIFSPKALSGRTLSLNTLHIHANRNRIDDARTAAEATHLEILEPIFATTCAAEAVLDEPEKKNGVLVIDLGGGSTGYSAYADGYVIATGVFGVGGDHVTNDIAHAFQTTNSQAEGMKRDEASATVGNDENSTARVKVEQGENTLMDNRTVSRRALDTVVNARLMELFTMIRETLEDQDVLHRMHSGAVLTGGGARMKDILPLAEQVLGLSVRIGRPINVDGLDDVEFPAEYATIAGALLYAHRNYEEHSVISDLLGRFFK